MNIVKRDSGIAVIEVAGNHYVVGIKPHCVETIMSSDAKDLGGYKMSSKNGKGVSQVATPRSLENALANYARLVAERKRRPPPYEPLYGLGDRVRWSHQCRGHWTTFEGLVIRVVQPKSPRTKEFRLSTGLIARPRLDEDLSSAVDEVRYIVAVTDNLNTKAYKYYAPKAKRVDLQMQAWVRGKSDG